jgi:hypothetical protein
MTPDMKIVNQNNRVHRSVDGAVAFSAPEPSKLLGLK